MEIKRVLKNLDVRISRLAKDLNISRPTLDNYIDCYENGKNIPNSTYQEIFDYLFDSENITPIEFAKKFDYVKRSILKDYNDNVNESKNKELRNSISDYAYDLDASPEMLNFLNLFIKSKNNDLVKAIVSYFNYVNGLDEYIEEENSDKQKAFYSQSFNIFNSYLTDTIELDSDAYQKFIEKSRRIYNNKEENPSNEEILSYLKSKVDCGSDIDIDYIKQLLEKRGN